jgi:Holliday junction resolvase
MGGGNYKSGSDFERQIKSLYEANGFVCQRSAGSHSAADLIAVKKEEGIMIGDWVQCKKERKKNGLYVKDIQQLSELPIGVGWRRVLFVKRKGIVDVKVVNKNVARLVGKFTVKEINGVIKDAN